MYCEKKKRWTSRVFNFKRFTNLLGISSLQSLQEGSPDLRRGLTFERLALVSSLNEVLLCLHRLPHHPTRKKRAPPTSTTNPLILYAILTELFVYLCFYLCLEFCVCCTLLFVHLELPTRESNRIIGLSPWTTRTRTRTHPMLLRHQRALHARINTWAWLVLLSFKEVVENNAKER